MLHKMIAVIISVLLCGTLFVSGNPAASVEEQRRAISFPNFGLPNPLCMMPMLCFAPCHCGSYRDHRGCDTCSCRPCDGTNWGDNWAIA